MLSTLHNRPCPRPLNTLTLATCGLLSYGCVLPTSSPSISGSRLCPFVGTEMVLTVAAESSLSTPAPEVIQAAADVAASRLAELAISPAAVFLGESGAIVVQLPAEVDINQVRSLLGNQGELTFRPQKVGDQYQELLPLLAERQAIAATDAAALEAVDVAILTLFDAPAIHGGDVQDADATLTFGERWEVAVDFTEKGAQQFADLTREVAGTGRAVGIFMDNELLSAPTVDVSYGETGITGGRAVISGTFSQAEAEAIALQIQSGAFPAPIEIASLQVTTIDENCEAESGDRL